ncbi:Fur family transcriptional regulator [Peptococcaceae bacterium 1198_IL3148]
MSFNNKTIEEYLKDHGIKPSFQRIRIFDYLVKHKNHPTVDGIFKALINEIPTLSKTTVYNTLKLFLEQGIVQLLVIEENETRYDADTSTHGHFKCEQCGKVYDISVDLSDVDLTELEKHQVNEQHIYFKGICHGCLNNK